MTTTENCESPNTSVPQKEETSTSTLPFNKPTINAWPEKKPVEDPKSNWHVFFLVAWLILMLIFLIAGTATPHVTVPGPMDSCTKYGLFQVKLCNGPSYAVADWKKWTSEACKAQPQHLQAASAFAILSILTVAAAIAIAIVQDVLHLVKVFNLLTGIVTGVAWFFMMLTWAIVAGFFTGKMCKGNDMSFSDDDNAEYSAGFFLFVISWLITLGVLAVWFIRQLQVFSPKMSEPLQNPKAHWHTFLMLFWLIILWMLVAAGSGVPHLRNKEIARSSGSSRSSSASSPSAPATPATPAGSVATPATPSGPAPASTTAPCPLSGAVAGIPADFDSEAYLALNPSLGRVADQQFGTQKCTAGRMGFAEGHYMAGGKAAGLKYKADSRRQAPIARRSGGQAEGCKKYGLFTIKTCGTAPATSVAKWDESTGLSSNCKAYKQHLQAAGAFAILSILTITVALAAVIVQDLLEIVTVFKFLSGIIAGASWFFMMIVWAIVAGMYNGKLCKGSDMKFSDLDDAKYTHGFFLFLIGWIFYIPVITVWFLKQLKVLPF